MPVPTTDVCVLWSPEWGVTQVIFGRDAELAELRVLLDDIRRGDGRALLLRGEAGTGKSTLLRQAAAHAADLRVYRLCGLLGDGRARHPYALVRQLCALLSERIDDLPRTHAAALRAACDAHQASEAREAREAGATDSSGGTAEVAGVATAPDPTRVGAALLALLGELAGTAPVLLVVDDADALDGMSARAVAHLARGLATAPVGLLLAGRGPLPDGPALGRALPELPLTGLDAAAARALLTARVPDIAPAVADRLATATAGNPLALREMPAALSAGQLSGGSPLPDPLPLDDRLRELFGRQLDTLTPGARDLLLIVAAEATGDATTVMAAAGRLGIGWSALAELERAGLLSTRQTALCVDRPLVAAVAYQDAPFMRRVEVHNIIADVLSTGHDADRGVPHRAAGTLGRDERLAERLTEVAGRARARGDAGGASAAFARAAELSGDPDANVARLLDAARTALAAGHPERARELLSWVDGAARTDAQRVEAMCVRAELEVDYGIPAVAVPLLTEAADALRDIDRRRAVALLVAAAKVTYLGVEPEPALRIGRMLVELGVDRDSPVGYFAHGIVAFYSDDPAARGECRPVTVERALAWLRDYPDFWDWPFPLAYHLEHLDPAIHQAMCGAVVRLGVEGRVAKLTDASVLLGLYEICAGHWDLAVDRLTAGITVATELGQLNVLPRLRGALAFILARTGRADEARQQARAAFEVASPRRMTQLLRALTWVRSNTEMFDGQPDAALDRLLPVLDPEAMDSYHGCHSWQPDVLGDAAEAAHRAGRVEAVRPVVERTYARFVDTGYLWPRAILTRARAMLADTDEEAIALLEESVELSARQGSVVHEAVARLLLGERLRRVGRRVRAREQLRGALEIFERLGMAPAAERARTELVATGDPATTVGVTSAADASAQLTPQERQIVRLAATGLSNKEIGAQLYLSARTVASHLYRAFPKLGIGSRAELAGLDRATL
jgi:DNA-binding CsgD family transcriptional regulator